MPEIRGPLPGVQTSLRRVTTLVLPAMVVVPYNRMVRLPKERKEVTGVSCSSIARGPSNTRTTSSPWVVWNHESYPAPSARSMVNRAWSFFRTRGENGLPHSSRVSMSATDQAFLVSLVPSVKGRRKECPRVAVYCALHLPASHDPVTEEEWVIVRMLLRHASKAPPTRRSPHRYARSAGERKGKRCFVVKPTLRRRSVQTYGTWHGRGNYTFV